MDTFNIVFGIIYTGLGLIFIAVALPLKYGKVDMNYFWGIRITKSYSSEKNWYLLNTYGGNKMLRWSLLLVVLGVVAFLLPSNDLKVLIPLYVIVPLVVVLVPLWKTIRSKTLDD